MPSPSSSATRRSWGRSTVDTSCPLDCPDACSLAVSVEQGKITKIDGSRRHNITNGFICAKVRGFAGRVYGDDRLHFPQIRTGPKGKGQFRRASWNEALGVIASRIDEERTRSGDMALPQALSGVSITARRLLPRR